MLEAAEVLGGGTRTSELTLPGLLHDECSGFHPLAVDTPLSRVVDLRAHGLEWLRPEVQYSHPLDGGRGAAAFRSVADTAVGLGSDGQRWQSMFGWLDERFDDIAEDFLRPMLQVPSHPFKLARFGLYSALPAALLARRFSSAEARFVGRCSSSRHAAFPESDLFGDRGGAGHRSTPYGWPVAKGGSSSISRAMISACEERGVRFETGVRVTSLDQVGEPDVLMLDLTPRAAADLIGDRMPNRVSRALRRYRHGPGAFKVEFAVERGVPWEHEPSRRAGTVHAVGGFAELASAERDVARGRMPEGPFVLVGQQSVADPSRANDGAHPVYSYAHVPAGWAGDATASIEAQIERFAPGFKDRILARHVRSVADMEGHNANYVGGDVVTGSNDPLQLVFRPRAALDPYSLGLPRSTCARRRRHPAPERTACRLRAPLGAARGPRQRAGSRVRLGQGLLGLYSDSGRSRSRLQR
ncbi:phytoene desaturase family protein [Nocardioides sp. WG-D5]